jgi:hypothetical protein
MRNKYIKHCSLLQKEILGQSSHVDAKENMLTNYEIIIQVVNAIISFLTVFIIVWILNFNFNLLLFL